MLTLAQFDAEVRRLVQRGLDAGLDGGEIGETLYEVELMAFEAKKSDLAKGDATDPVPCEPGHNDGGIQPAAPSGDLGRILETGAQRNRFANVVHQSRHGGMPEPNAADLEAFAASLDRDTSRPWPSGPCWERLRFHGYYTTEHDLLTGNRHIPTEKGLAAVAHLRRGAA